MYERENLDTKTSLIITAVCFSTHLIPIAILFPLFIGLMLCAELPSNTPMGFFIGALSICSVIYVIGIFFAPAIQIILAIMTLIQKRWRWAMIHTASAFVLCGGIALTFKVFEYMSYAT